MTRVDHPPHGGMVRTNTRGCVQHGPGNVRHKLNVTTMIVTKEILRVEAGSSFCLYEHREPEPMMDMHPVTAAECVERGSPTPLVHIDGGCIDLQCVFCGAEFLTHAGRAGPCIKCGAYLD